MHKQFSSFSQAKGRKFWGRQVQRVLCCLTVVVLASATAAKTGYAADKVSLVKSAYIFNFTKFVLWPQLPDQVTVCAFGENKLGDALKGIEIESTPQYPVLVQPNIALLAVTGCQMVYIDTQQNPHAMELFAAVRDLPVLTVGEGSDFIEKGGMVAFVNEASRIKLEVNVKAAEKVGLKLDPQLLEIARRVVR